MEKREDKRLAIIGAGKVGIALGYLLQKKGWQITEVASRSQDSLKRARTYVAAPTTTDLRSTANSADVILIAVNDDQIEPVCRKIAEVSDSLEGKVILHLSGALETSVLKAARDKGAQVGSIHPLQSFATVDNAIKLIPSTVFGVTAEDKALIVAEKFVADLEGEFIEIKDEDKPIYHAAACIVCNYMVATFDYAKELLNELGISSDLAVQAFLPLLKGSVSNIEACGSPTALTGPIARGDSGTVEKHIQAFNRKLPDKKWLYEELGKYTTEVALRKGTIDEAKRQELLDILGG